MGCGCAKVAKNQKELIDDIKTERTKNEEEIKKLQADIEKANAAANAAANPGATAGATGAQTQAQPQPQPNANPTPTPAPNLDEIKKNIDGRTKFAQGLFDIEEELKKAEYNELGALSDLVTKYFNIPTAKSWDDISKVVEEIRTFCAKNVKPKVGKTQLEISNLVEAGVIKAETEGKGKNLEEEANAWLKEYTAALTTSREELKKGDYNNLETLGNLIDALNKGYDAKNLEEIKKLHQDLKGFFTNNLKPK